jgi:SAM-dependent methyltransferase
MALAVRIAAVVSPAAAVRVLPVAGARAGHGQVVLVLGEAGMGKSMLAGWLVSQAEQTGMQVARGACSAAGMPPLRPWRRALAAIGSQLPRREDSAATGPSGRELMAAAIVEAVATAAKRRPLLIVLEDLQWSDPVSVLVARAAAEASAALPLMLLLTCRDEQDEATQQVRDRLAEMPASVRRMLLPPLDADAVTILARAIAAPDLTDEETASLHARTGGNPFFLLEVPRLMIARGPAATLMVPPGVREVLQRRMARLSQPCAELLTAAAIIAETAAEAIEDDLLRPVSRVSDQAAAVLLDEAAAGRLLAVDPAGAARYRFRHALIREVLDHGMSATRRGELHAAAGLALEQRVSSPAPAARLAYHWPRATSPEARERAVAWSLRAARDAVAGFGFEAAAAHYARALAGQPDEPITVAVEYGGALQMCGDLAAAEHGVAGRVDLEVADLADDSADWSPRYDLVLLIECVHDLPRPVEALQHARAAVRSGGTVLVVDERAAETFTAPGDLTERFFAAASAIWCLPQGRVGADPEPVGALIRPAAMRDLARRAGYADAEILPIEHPAWRFYRMVA